MGPPSIPAGPALRHACRRVGACSSQHHYSKACTGRVRLSFVKDKRHTSYCNTQLLAIGPLRTVVRATVIPFPASVSPIDSTTGSLRDAPYELLVQALGEVGSVEHLNLDGQAVDVPYDCVLMRADTGEMGAQEARVKAREVCTRGPSV